MNIFIRNIIDRIRYRKFIKTRKTLSTMRNDGVRMVNGRINPPANCTCNDYICKCS